MDAISRSLGPLARGWETGLSHPFGNGIATGAGIGRIFYKSNLETAEGSSFIENEFGRALSELGVVGATIWLLMLLRLMWSCILAIRAMGATPEGTLSAAMFGVMTAIFVILSVGSALYGAEPGMYFWIFGAAILRLRQFVTEEQAVAAPGLPITGRRKFGFVSVPPGPVLPPRKEIAQRRANWRD
jgi:hypothetical protein